MACGMIVQLPVTGVFGTDEDFDLRTQLERELASALAHDKAGECGRGETDDGRMNVYLESIADPIVVLRVVKDVLMRLKQLQRATVVLETRCEADSDDIDHQVLWAVHHNSPDSHGLKQKRLATTNPLAPQAGGCAFPNSRRCIAFNEPRPPGSGKLNRSLAVILQT